jgi:hypothetical protein
MRSTAFFVLLLLLVIMETYNVASLRHSDNSIRLDSRTVRRFHSSAMRKTLSLRGGSPPDLSKSWKDMVREDTEVPYEIMGSPMTPDDELKRLQALRKVKRAEEEVQLKKPVQPWSAVPRPPPGPNGTYGAPDLTGTRWKELKAGQSGYPYPRVPQRYFEKNTLADTDPYLLWLNRANVSSDQDMHMDDWADEEEDVDAMSLANM